MREHIDGLARTMAGRTTRRSAVAGLGALALGALGIVGTGQRTAANNNDCQQCKKQCRRNNQKAGKKDPNNCGKKCHDKCNRN